MDDSASLLSGILAQYDLGQVTSVEPQAGGGIDESFVVTAASGRFFLKRRSPAYTPDMVGCDHALVQFLVSHGFPTPPVLPTRQGHTWVEWEGRIYEAYAYVEGRGYTLGDLRQLASLGRTVARYHRLASQYRPARLKLPPWQDTSLARFLDMGGYVAPRLETLLARGWIGEREAQFVHDLTKELKEQARQVEKAGLAPLTIHGALEPGNVLFNEEGEVIALVDWADSSQFVRAFDVAHALLKFAGRRADAVLPGQVGPVLPWSSVEAFASAYRQGIALSEAEMATLPWLMLAMRLVDALWVDEVHPLDHRLELGLAQELRTWLAHHAAAIQKAFRSLAA